MLAGKGARVDDWSGLENRRGFTPSVGSNPTPSAIILYNMPEGVLHRPQPSRTFPFWSEPMKFPKLRKGDLILIVVLIIIGVCAITYTTLFARRAEQGKRVIVEIDGQVVREFSLSEEVESVRFDTPHGYNILNIADNRVRISEADCPDKLCVLTGWRQQVGQVIVCLPHRLIVRIVGDNGGAGEQLDGVTY